MLNLLINRIKSMDVTIKSLIQKGSYFCLGVLFFSSILLFTYESFYNSPDLYYIGLSVFQLGITFFAAFLCCGFVFNEILQE